MALIFFFIGAKQLEEGFTATVSPFQISKVT
jgi:hypothetical protein